MSNINRNVPILVEIMGQSTSDNKLFVRSFVMKRIPLSTMYGKSISPNDYE